MRDPGAFAGVLHYKGELDEAAGFCFPLFGAMLTVRILVLQELSNRHASELPQDGEVL
jgi:hypothetical protein